MSYWVDLGTYSTRADGVRVVVGKHGTTSSVVGDAIKAENINAVATTDVDGDGITIRWDSFNGLAQNRSFR